MSSTDPVADSNVVTDETETVRTESVHAGDVIVLADVIGTVAFTVTALTAAIVFSTAAQWVGAITAMSLFAVGVFAFLWSFYNAAQRSREEEIAVLQMYLLLGSPTPPRVRRIMLSMLAVQIVVALATALGRSEADDGSPGTSLAVGILVPMFGIGLNGLWCAFHGVFPPRTFAGTGAGVGAGAGASGNEAAGEGTVGTTSDTELGQNGDHG